MPLKQVEPFVIRVDNSTGIVDVVPVYTGRADFPEAVTRYLLTHYVTVCERFNFATAESDYRECGAFNGKERNQSWAALWATSNPLSPLNVYKASGRVQVQVSAVSFFKRASGVADLAQVRYVRAERQGSSGAEHLSHWIATIQYAYAEPAKDLEIRKWNPLGFKIIEFHPEPEMAGEPAKEGVR
jgi:type IV secretion system protein VirB8